jgi:hypothetical protein
MNNMASSRGGLRLSPGVARLRVQNLTPRRFSNRAVGGKLSVAGVAGIKVLSELGAEAGIIMASDGSSGSMLSHSRHRPGRDLA